MRRPDRIFSVRARKRGHSTNATIPPPIRDHLGIRPGDILDWCIAEDGQVVLCVHLAADGPALLVKARALVLEAAERAEIEGERKRQAGQREGHARGYMQSLGDDFREGRCYNPQHQAHQTAAAPGSPTAAPHGPEH